jgi:hypothetical protein
LLLKMILEYIGNHFSFVGIECYFSHIYLSVVWLIIPYSIPLSCIELSHPASIWQMYLKMPGDTLAAMTIENILLYVGIGLIVFGFVSYLVCMHMERYYDRKLYELQQRFKK